MLTVDAVGCAGRGNSSGGEAVRRSQSVHLLHVGCGQGGHGVDVTSLSGRRH